MRRLSRRRLLTGLGTATAVGLAGCSGGDDGSPDETPEDEKPSEDDETPDNEGVDVSVDASFPPALEKGLSYIYPPETETAILRTSQPDAGRGAYPDPDEFYMSDDSEIDRLVRVRPGPDQERSDSVSMRVVLVGSIDITETEEVQSTGTVGEFEQYRLGTGEERGGFQIATDGEVLLAGPKAWLGRTFENMEGDAETFLESNSRAEALLAQFSHTDYNVTVATGREFIESDVGSDEFEFSTVPHGIAFGSKQRDGTIDLGMATLYASQVGQTERTEFATFAESEFDIRDPAPESHADGRVLATMHNREFVPPEERPETPDSVRFAGYDTDEDIVLFEFADGDAVPASNFEIEVSGETYTGDWTRGQDQISGGSVIGIDADAIEPGDSMTITYEGDGFSSSSGTSVLRFLPFRARYDPEEGQATVGYVDGPPLDAARVSVSTGSGEQVSPWEGDLTPGDTATIERVELGGYFEVTYQRTDGDEIDIGGGELTPPGTFELEYDGQRGELTVTYPEFSPDDKQDRRRYHTVPEQRPVQTENYQVRVDGEPAATQLTEAGDTVEPGDSLTVSDVPTGVSASVRWHGQDGESFTMAEIAVTTPTVSFEFGFEDGNVVVTHAGGMDVDASRLAIEVMGPSEKTVEWDSTDTVTEGDSQVVEDVGEDGFVVVRFDENVLAEQYIRALREGEDEGK